MDAEELPVEERCDRQRLEGADARLVHRRGVLVQALALEGEVLCEVSAFVVAPQQEKTVGIPELKGIKIQ